MYRIETFGNRNVSGGDMVELDENSIRVFMKGRQTREYPWSDFTHFDFQHFHHGYNSNNYICFLHFNNGNRIMVDIKDNQEVMEFVRNHQPKKKKLRLPLIVTAFAVVFVAFALLTTVYH